MNEAASSLKIILLKTAVIKADLARYSSYEMEIIRFIKGKGKLFSEPVMTEFVQKFPNQHNGILGWDAAKFVHKFNSDTEYVDDKSYVINARGVLVYVMDGAHMFYLYNDHERGIIEKWDPSSWQHTTNNCTLYSALVAIIRPLKSFKKTKKLIQMLVDTPNTETAMRLAAISKHFFGRGYECFEYRTSAPATDKKLMPHKMRSYKAVTDEY